MWSISGVSISDRLPTTSSSNCRRVEACSSETLNARAADASLALAAYVFQQGLLTDRAAGDIGWAKVALQELHGDAALRALGAAGAQVRTGIRVTGVVRASFELLHLSQLWNTSYGLTLLAKTAVLLVALAAGWFVRKRIRVRLEILLAGPVHHIVG